MTTDYKALEEVNRHADQVREAEARRQSAEALRCKQLQEEQRRIYYINQRVAVLFGAISGAFCMAGLMMLVGGNYVPGLITAVVAVVFWLLGLRYAHLD